MTSSCLASWLESTVDSSPEFISHLLLQKLKELASESHRDIVFRANLVLGIIFKTLPSVKFGEQPVDVRSGNWVEKCKARSLRLYYRILNSMLLSEIQRLGTKSVTSLVANERFHRCMLVCSVEIIFFNYVPHKLLFPHIIELVGVTPFDMGKATEGFAKYEKSLPGEVKRHLNFCDENILQSLAWKAGSSMYSALIFAKKKFAPEISQQKLLPEPMPSLDQLSYSHLTNDTTLHSDTKLIESSSQSKASPVSDISQQRNSPCVTNSEQITPNATSVPSISFPSTSPSTMPQHPHLLYAFSSPQAASVNESEIKAADIQIKVFFEKVLKLAAIRICALWERMHHLRHFMDQVYCVFHYALHHETALFFNRHIDQIMLCCVYGVCKVNQLSVTFKDIISNYRKQSQCRTENFRSVIIKPSSDCSSPPVMGDIIRFYNEVFVLRVKNFLLRIGNIAPSPSSPLPSASLPSFPPNQPNTSETTDIPPPFPLIPYVSPKKVSSQHNVYVSPLPSSKKEALLVPNGQTLVASIGEENDDLLSTSRFLTEINNRLASSRLCKVKANDSESSQNVARNKYLSAKNSQSFVLNNSNTTKTKFGASKVGVMSMSVSNPPKRFRIHP